MRQLLRLALNGILRILLRRQTTFKQGTIVEMVESERLMVATAAKRYGEFYEHAAEATVLFSNFVKSVSKNQTVFAQYLSIVKTHHTLALFSTVRLHQVQSTMDLRQVLEAGAFAACAIAKSNPYEFVEADAQGLLSQPKKLTTKLYQWLDTNYPNESGRIKELKDQINGATAHANLIWATNIFKAGEKHHAAPFFDFEDDHVVKVDLWRIGNIALALLDLFTKVNLACKTVVFIDDFATRFERLAVQNAQLLSELTSSERHKRAAAKAMALDA